MMGSQNDKVISDKKNGPGNMAETVALARVLESEKPEDERICYDPYAIRFISPGMRAFMEHEPEKFRAANEQINRTLPGYVNSVVARVRYIDEVVKSSVTDGFGQLVILGSGYDTRAYRIEGLKDIKVFEVDRPEMIGVKKDKIKEIFGELPAHVAYIPLDLDNDGMKKGLAKYGYDPSLKTLFVLEGLIYYLTPGAVDSLLSFIVHNSKKGSAIVLDYGRVNPNTSAGGVQGAGTTGFDYAKERGEPVKSYVDGTIETFLSARGFSNIKNMESADYKKAYFHGKNANREVSELAAFAYAVVI
jgi:methyltransferase (TIGR00027 family)